MLLFNKLMQYSLWGRGSGEIIFAMQNQPRSPLPRPLHPEGQATGNEGRAFPSSDRPGCQTPTPLYRIN